MLVFSIVFAGAFTLSLPFLLLAIARRKWTDMSRVPFVWGLVMYTVFAFILQSSILDGVIMRQFLGLQKDGSMTLALTAPLFFSLVTGFQAGVFEETARFVSFNILKRKHSGLKTAVSYGIGHGGVESIIMVGLTAVISLIILAYHGKIGSGLRAELVAAQYQDLITTPIAEFWWSAYERVPACAIHIGLSVINWCAVNVKGKKWLFPVAILMHTTVDFTVRAAQLGLEAANPGGVGGINRIATEALTTIFTVVICIAARKIYKKYAESGQEEK
ncbi:MAG: YhfC family intramembrane metalloprotease [Clostridiales bacterium]|jgi:uncharacterized membrane protein YhfC|nr:YhfC family intramembrane metalloprotease [Clostridiales bacterium]